MGKFNPPHVGHLHLIGRGAADVDVLYVLVCDRPDQTIPAADRAAWLADAAPANVTVLITPDDLPEANEPWAARALEVLPEAPTLAVVPVDTVGAGDAFAGCFAARLAKGEILWEAVLAANCAGALTTLRPGAQGPIPDRETVDQHRDQL